MGNTDHKDPQQAVFSNPVLFRPLGPNIFLNIIFSNTLGLIPPSMWKTKFDTHTKQQAELYFCIFLECKGSKLKLQRKVQVFGYDRQTHGQRHPPLELFMPHTNILMWSSSLYCWANTKREVWCVHRYVQMSITMIKPMFAVTLTFI